MSAEMIRRLERLQHALGVVSQKIPSQMQLQKTPPGSPIEGYIVDPAMGQSVNEADLEQEAHNLVASIASLKDHLKAWCKNNNKTHDVENFVSSNPDAAIIHDLWNNDKHAVLTRPPKSGYHPKLRKLGRGLTPTSLSGGFSVNGSTGTFTNNGVTLDIVGEIYDEKTNMRIGDFTETYDKAIVAWEKEIKKAGIPI